MQIDLVRQDDLPALFGDYELQEILGAGGMGRVFRAELRRGRSFRKACAIKILYAAVAARAQPGQGLEAEARLGGLLRHPNIVEIYDFGEVQRQPFIAMELVDGRPLDALLHDVGALPPEVVLEIGVQIADGLAHAHTLVVKGKPANLVHRDMKPANLILSRRGQLKIADFGIAKAALLDGPTTATGIAKGTPAFMSPEQARGERLDARSDLFSVGAILYEASTGDRLFGGTSLLEIISAVAQVEERLADPAAMDAVEARVPGLGPIVRRCLRGEAADRFGTAAELLAALKGLQGDRPDLGAWLAATQGVEPPEVPAPAPAAPPSPAPSSSPEAAPTPSPGAATPPSPGAATADAPGPADRATPHEVAAPAPRPDLDDDPLEHEDPWRAPRSRRPQLLAGLGLLVLLVGLGAVLLGDRGDTQTAAIPAEQAAEPDPAPVGGVDVASPEAELPSLAVESTPTPRSTPAQQPAKSADRSTAPQKAAEPRASSRSPRKPEREAPCRTTIGGPHGSTICPHDVRRMEAAAGRSLSVDRLVELLRAESRGQLEAALSLIKTSRAKPLSADGRAAPVEAGSDDDNLESSQGLLALLGTADMSSDAVADLLDTPSKPQPIRSSRVFGVSWEGIASTPEADRAEAEAQIARRLPIATRDFQRCLAEAPGQPGTFAVTVRSQMHVDPEDREISTHRTSIQEGAKLPPERLGLERCLQNKAQHLRIGGVPGLQGMVGTLQFSIEFEEQQP